MPFAGVECIGSHAMLNVRLFASALASSGSIVEPAGVGSLRHSSSLAASHSTILYPCYQNLAAQTQYIKLGKKKLFPVSIKEICVGVESLMVSGLKNII